MRCYFISISSLSFFPVFKYILESFIKQLHNQVISYHLVESHLRGFPEYSHLVCTHYYAKFKSIDDFNKMSFWFKIKRYLWAVYFSLKAIFSKKAIIYTCDYQVLYILIFLLKFFPKKNTKIIYHQFELIENNHKKNILSHLKKNQTYIDLIIFPEINRREYFLIHTQFNFNKSIIFPNTCSINNNKITKHNILQQFKNDDIIIAHIGNVGFNHFFNEFIHNFIKADLPNTIKLIFIGKQSEQLKDFIKKNTYNNIYFYNELPHYELPSIYNYIDYGLILYKPIDLNFDYCAPNKLYEYWAHGVPVIAHKLKGLSGIVTDKLGYIYDFNNLTKDIFAHIKKLSSEQRNLIKKEFSDKFEVSKYQIELQNKLKEVIA